MSKVVAMRLANLQCLVECGFLCCSDARKEGDSRARLIDVGACPRRRKAFGEGRCDRAY